MSISGLDVCLSSYFFANRYCCYSFFSDSHETMIYVLIRRKRLNRFSKFRFLSCVSILTRDIDIANLSVRLSVRYVPVLYENGLTYCHSFFHHTVAQSLSFCQHQTSSRNSDGVTPCGGTKYSWGIKISRFWTNNFLYLANDTR